MSANRESLFPAERLTLMEAFDLRYHVPRNQCYGGSRGGQSGNVHLHVKRGEAFESGRIRRVETESLCGRMGWYERPPESEAERVPSCPRCIEIGKRMNGRLTGLVNV